MAGTTMTHGSGAAMDIEAQIDTPNARVQLVRYRFDEPPESRMRLEDSIRVELCLDTRHRSARACYSDFWSPARFEKIGDVFAIPPTINAHVRSDEAQPLTSVLCHLPLPQVLSLFDRVPPFLEQHLLLSLDIRDSHVRYLLMRMADELRHPGFASKALVESIATQLSIDLLRYGHALREQPTHAGLAPWQLRRIEERLSEVREAPSLQELAALCDLSVRQLARGFRSVRGCSVGRYVAERQVLHAKRLLGTDHSIAAIATTLGFASTSNFCAAFRRVAGISPGDYRHSLHRPWAATAA